ncbi:MAG: hypothetical protein WD555_05350 [Fulvivirga sp.]
MKTVYKASGFIVGLLLIYNISSAHRFNQGIGLRIGDPGVEYELQDYPVVTFGEVSLMGEIVDKPLRFRLFVGVGVRYAF